MNTALLFGITWASTHYMWIFILSGLIIALYCYYHYRVRTVVQLLAGRWQSLLIVNYYPHRQYLKTMFFAFATLLMAAALMRPQWNKREQVIAQEGRDILIALDISKSMLAQDCGPNRLEYAKKKIKKLLALLESERVGLLLFSGSAMVQCPLTTDYGAFHMFLDHVDVETISSGSTAIDGALKETMRLFENSPEGKHKLMVLFTDGEDFSTELAPIKAQAKKQGVRIVTMGMGTPEGAPIPLYDNNGLISGHQKDRDGKIVISQRNDEMLRGLAHDLEGIYIPTSTDQTDLKSVVNYVQRFEKGRFEDKKIHQLQDQYHWFLLGALLFCLFELML